MPENTSTDVIDVYFHNEGKTYTLNLEEYLCGVVGAEMPASFETEALKAQAVAARSYAVYRKENPSPDHPDACVCTDYTHCKAYKESEELASAWGNNAKENQRKISQAVFSTTGEILVYNGEAALAVFHSQSGNGRTENSEDVWGGDIPYLVSVESYGDEKAPGYNSSVTVPFTEFKNTIEKNVRGITVGSISDIGMIEKSEGGAVKNIEIGGVRISGKDMRSYFNLRSSNFSVAPEGDNIVFSVTGYGHGVGMSQYGANAMAKDNKTYKDILKHYYTGTEIVSMQSLNNGV